MKFINGFIFKTFFATIILQNALQLVLGQEVSSKSILSICGGGYHACAVFGDKAAKCWGLKLAFGESDSYVDNAGDVAIELKENLAIINPGSSSSFNGVDCGFWHTCLRLESKQLKCIGDNQYGQTGSGAETSLTGSKTGFSGDSLAPVNIGTGLEILAFTLGVSHTCIGVTGNRVKCFGLNDKGQLGYGDINNRGTSTSHMGDYLGFVNLGTNVEVASLHTGPSANHNCIVIFKPTASSQRIKCWGSNEYYQLGYGDINHRGDALGEMGDNLLLVDLGTESRVKQLTLGSQHTCALLQNDGLKCWGTGSNGQLGSGSQTTISSTGNAIPFLITNTKATILFFNAGSNYLCVLENDYITLKCIGKNDKGQLGQGDTMNRGDKPTSTLDLLQKISFGTGATRISGFVSGSDFNCVVFEDSSVKCFGDNSHGQLAIGNTNNMGDGANEMGDKLPYAQLNKYSSDNTKDATNQPGLDPATSTTITIIIVIIIFCACCGAISKRCKRKQQFSSGPGVHVNVNVSSPASAHPQPMYPYMMPYHHPMMHHQSSKFEQPPPAPSTPKKKDIEKEVVMAIAVDSKDSGSIRGLQTGSSRNVQNDGTPTAKISNTTPLSGKKQFAFVSHV